MYLDFLTTVQPYYKMSMKVLFLTPFLLTLYFKGNSAKVIDIVIDLSFEFEERNVPVHILSSRNAKC